jgi:hypothetical protein
MSAKNSGADCWRGVDRELNPRLWPQSPGRRALVRSLVVTSTKFGGMRRATRGQRLRSWEVHAAAAPGGYIRDEENLADHDSGGPQREWEIVDGERHHSRH